MNAPVRDKWGQFAKKTKRSAAAYKNAALEYAIQRTFIAWAKLCLAREVLVFSIPNEGCKAKASKFIAIGLYPGAADVGVVYQGLIHFIEFKTKKGPQEPDQRGFEQHAAEAGAPYIIARSFDDAIKAIEDWGIPHTDKSRRT